MRECVFMPVPNLERVAEKNKKSQPQQSCGVFVYECRDFLSLKRDNYATAELWGMKPI